MGFEVIDFWGQSLYSFGLRVMWLRGYLVGDLKLYGLRFWKFRLLYLGLRIM